VKHSKEIRKLLRQELKEFAKLEKDWDSCGGYPITKEALKTAKHFLDGLFIAPLSSGGLDITLGDEEVFILVQPDGTWETGACLDSDGGLDN